MGCGASALVAEADGPPPRFCRVVEHDHSVPQPTFEPTHVPAVDDLLSRAADFAGTLVGMNNAINQLVLQARAAAGSLQGGFYVGLAAAPNTDFVAVEVRLAPCAAHEPGHPPGAEELAELAQREAGAALAMLAAAIEDLHDLLARMALRTASGSLPESVSLRLTPGGLLKGLVGGKLPGEVAYFNVALDRSRAALGGRYRLVVHLHKAQPHGAPGLRLRVQRSMVDTEALKQQQQQQQQQQQPSLAPKYVTDAASVSVSGFGRTISGLDGPDTPRQGAAFMVPVTALDLSGSGMGRAVRTALAAALQEVNSVAALLQETDGVTLEAAPAGVQGVMLGNLQKLQAASGQHAALAAATAQLNSAIFSLAWSCLTVDGRQPTFTDLLQRVLQEVLANVQEAAGVEALASFKPKVTFVANADMSYTFELSVPLLPEWGLPDFPRCLSSQTRRAWQALCDVQRNINAVAGQLGLLRSVFGCFLTHVRGRLGTIAEEAAAAQLPIKEAVGAARALGRSYKELRGSMRVFGSLGRLLRMVVEEMRQAAQSAEQECELSMALAWADAAATPNAAWAPLAEEPSSATSSAEDDPWDTPAHASPRPPPEGAADSCPAPSTADLAGTGAPAAGPLPSQAKPHGSGLADGAGASASAPAGTAAPSQALAAGVAPAVTDLPPAQQQQQQPQVQLPPMPGGVHHRGSASPLPSNLRHTHDDDPAGSAAASGRSSPGGADHSSMLARKPSMKLSVRLPPEVAPSAAPSPGPSSLGGSPLRCVAGARPADHYPTIRRPSVKSSLLAKDASRKKREGSLTGEYAQSALQHMGYLATLTALQEQQQQYADAAGGGGGGGGSGGHAAEPARPPLAASLQATAPTAVM